MAARAMWKAVLTLGAETVPIKMYAALQDRRVHFRLLDAKDNAPVKQKMINPETESVVSKENIKRGVVSSEGDVVVLEEEELESLQPKPSREIRLLHFLPASAIDRRFYRRPYYLGPDGSLDKYSALVSALAESDRTGLAQWVMRNKSYVGALRVHQGYLLLIALRHAEEVVSVDTVDTPKSVEPNEREVQMSRQLIDMLAADFEPEQYHDEYRERVQSLVQTKASGGKITSRQRRPKPPPPDLSTALEASIAEEKRYARRS